MKYSAVHFGRAASATAAAKSKIIRLKTSVVKLLRRCGVARREIFKRADRIAGASRSAPLELSSLVTFLFRDKKVTQDYCNPKFFHRGC